MSEEKAVLDPWGSIEIGDYNKAFESFGLKKWPDTWTSKIEDPLFRRKIVIAHRDFERVLERIENKKPFINMTGIATSGPLHFGHKTIVDIFKVFKKLGGKSYFGIADIDAYTSRPDSKIPTMTTAKELAVNNLANILALGLSKSDVYIQSQMPPRYYEFTFELSKKITTSTFQAIYGDLDLGKVSANLLQYADILHGQLPQWEGPMPSITAIGIEQDPHLRAVRDIAKRLPYKFELPSSIYIVHQPGLLEKMKMSSSILNSAIFLDDAPEVAQKKIMNAFSGGQATMAEHKKLGGNPDVDRAYQLLRFHHPDDKKVAKIYHDFKSGSLLSGELKQICAEWVMEFLKNHQARFKKMESVARKMIFG